MKEQPVEPITLPEFVDAYQECTMMQLWDFLAYNGYVITRRED